MTGLRSVTVVVKDANILIDLLHADLLSCWHELGIPTLTTDMVVSEITSPIQSEALRTMIATGALMVKSIDGSEISAIQTLRSVHKVSIQDSSVLHLSKCVSATLLTGDGKLRKAAETIGIDVVGMLGILDCLVEQKVISASRAKAALEKMLAKGSRLPEEGVAQRLNEWI